MMTNVADTADTSNMNEDTAEGSVDTAEGSVDTPTGSVDTAEGSVDISLHMETVSQADFANFKKSLVAKVAKAQQKYDEKEFKLAQVMWHEALSDAINHLSENDVQHHPCKISIWKCSKTLIENILLAEEKRKETMLLTAIDWEGIVGLEHAKQIFVETLIWPKAYPELYSDGAAVAASGILLFGPPGTGKSMIARTAAKSTGCHFIELSVSNLMSPLQGVSEMLVKNYFEEARLNKPSVIFLDEIESLTSTRRDNSSEGSARVKSELLVQTQLPNDGVLLIGATNLPETIDQAFRRRFQKKIYIPMPNESDRKKMLSIWVMKTCHSLATADLLEIAKSTDGYSAADMFLLFQEGIATSIRTKLGTMSNDQPMLTKEALKGAMARVKPTVTRAEIRIHDRFASKWCIENINQGDPKPSSSKFSMLKKTAKNILTPGFR